MSTSASARVGRHKQLPDAVAGYVREQIMSGNLRPGEFLRMEPIAEAVGVSITPVREGLLRLSNEGFVTAVPRRGFMVAEFTRQDVRDLFWVQSQLAGELAARAATTIDDETLARVHEVMLQCEAAVERHDTVAIGDLGHEFHRLINLSASSDHLARLYGSIVKHLPNSFYASIEAHVRTVVPEHRETYAALETRDGERAREITEHHIVNSADFVIAMLEERGLWAD
ncbi:GntR family transcriptional regulator [Gordonia neofelifaecis]|uniref:GntR family transcriptional regulator n=1 Tax=Gordonia neofelifaecis NRRL B-59395 TaxID=644548 RepID=F1YK85_9ACTN|nr:GntR family transcriptional regulator [Gordonia neofelifaecis]EGD54931.1 GntR family transcriptional regulator [Gordonia neofelifaecis NRRL B-59395]